MATFDQYRQSAHATVSAVMGDLVTWTPTGGMTISVKCTLERPTDQRPYAEGNGGEFINNVSVSGFGYQSGDFPGLFESVQSGELEYVDIDLINAAGTVIESLGSFAVLAVHKVSDGHYFRAQIEAQ